MADPAFEKISHLINFVQDLLLAIWALAHPWLLQRWVNSVLVWWGIQLELLSGYWLPYLLHLLLGFSYSLFPLLDALLSRNQLVGVFEQNVAEEELQWE